MDIRGLATERFQLLVLIVIDSLFIVGAKSIVAAKNILLKQSTVTDFEHIGIELINHAFDIVIALFVIKVIITDIHYELCLPTWKTVSKILRANKLEKK